MPSFGRVSRTKLEQAHPQLQQIAVMVVEGYDHSIITGHRPKEEQDEKFRLKLSKARWPDSKHNKKPAMALDIAPYFKEYGGAITGHPDQIKAIAKKVQRTARGETLEEAALRVEVFVREQYAMLAGRYLQAAADRGFKLRWGGDWDQDNDTLDNTFDDLMHVELVE